MTSKLRATRWLPTAAVLLAAAVRADSSEQSTAPARPPLQDPTILLIRDGAIRKELKLAPEKAAAIDDLLQDHNRLLLAIRDVGPTRADASAQPALLELRDQLKGLLSPAQKQRLFGLALQAQEYDSLTRDDVAELLRFTPEQREEVERIMDDFWNRSRALQQSGSTDSPDDLKTKLEELQAERHGRVLELFDDRQTRKWAEMLGAPFELSVVHPSPASAPEFEEVDEWINSEPLAFEALRGKVVVVHFFAFGCINCIHNYPWYREWQKDFAGQDVVIVGIHTPETQTETDNQLLREKLAENGLEFPVAVDKAKKNWEAWSNNIWPAVYLVDKRGRLRYWWYGELDWKGAGGQKVAHQRIEELLAEPAPDEPASTAPSETASSR